MKLRSGRVVPMAERYSDSDKLAFVLACLAGIMAIILFFIGRTRLAIVVVLSVSVSLSIYPTL